MWQRIKNLLPMAVLPSLPLQLTMCSMAQMSYKVQKITDPVLLGEGPYWHESQRALFFISIHEKTIHKYQLDTGIHTKTKTDGRVGFMVPVEATTDQFIVGMDRKFLKIQWDGQDGSPVNVVRDLGEVDQHAPKNRINDGKADPRGRIFAGTMGLKVSPGVFEKGKGSLYRIDSTKGGKIERVADKIGVSNGLAWDLKEKAFYYIDSLEKKIRRYDYDVETGNISNPTYIFDLLKNNINGLPDGITIDTDGNLWIAVFESSCIFKVNPRTGKFLDKIRIPVKQVTSATFGGPNYDILFVTTGRVNNGDELTPQCGATFMVTGLGVKGHPNFPFKIESS